MSDYLTLLGPDTTTASDAEADLSPSRRGGYYSA
jgi:hypothetical protein